MKIRCIHFEWIYIEEVDTSFFFQGLHGFGLLNEDCAKIVIFRHKITIYEQ